jgi:hypothetical protein
MNNPETQALYTKQTNNQITQQTTTKHQTNKQQHINHDEQQGTHQEKGQWTRSDM